MADPAAADPPAAGPLQLRSLAGLGPVRRMLAILLRASVVTLIVLALAEVQTVRQERQADDDVPRRRLAERPARAARPVPPVRHRGLEEAAQGRPGRGDRLRQGAERRGTPVADRGATSLGIESTIDPEYTDLAGADQARAGDLPRGHRAADRRSSPTATRTAATPLEQALAAKDLGVQIDVVPIDYFYDKEVLVEKVSIPPDVKKGETVNINVVDPRQRADQRDACRSSRRLDNYRARPRQREAGRRSSSERGVNVFTPQAADHRAQLLYVHRRVHPRQGQRRPPGDQQRGRGVHPRPRAPRRSS